MGKQGERTDKRTDSLLELAGFHPAAKNLCMIESKCNVRILSLAARYSLFHYLEWISRSIRFKCSIFFKTWSWLQFEKNQNEIFNQSQAGMTFLWKDFFTTEHKIGIFSRVNLYKYLFSSILNQFRFGEFK